MSNQNPCVCWVCELVMYGGPVRLSLGTFPCQFHLLASLDVFFMPRVSHSPSYLPLGCSQQAGQVHALSSLAGVFTGVTPPYREPMARAYHIYAFVVPHGAVLIKCDSLGGGTQSRPQGILVEPLAEEG